MQDLKPSGNVYQILSMGCRGLTNIKSVHTLKEAMSRLRQSVWWWLANGEHLCMKWVDKNGKDKDLTVVSVLINIHKSVLTLTTLPSTIVGFYMRGHSAR